MPVLYIDYLPKGILGTATRSSEHAASTPSAIVCARVLQ